MGKYCWLLTKTVCFLVIFGVLGKLITVFCCCSSVLVGCNFKGLHKGGGVLKLSNVSSGSKGTYCIAAHIMLVAAGFGFEKTFCVALSTKRSISIERSLMAVCSPKSVKGMARIWVILCTKCGSNVGEGRVYYSCSVSPGVTVLGFLCL